MPFTESQHCDNEITATSGVTWINVSWSHLCEVEDPTAVSYYHLLFKDNTASIYHQDTIHHCKEENCHFYFNNARPCIDYTIHLWAIVGEQNYTYTSVDIRTGDEIPSSPTHLTVRSVSQTNVFLSWMLPNEGEYCVDSYNVCWDSTHTRDISCQDTSTSFTNMTISTLQPCSEYRIQVKPVTRDGSHGPSAIVVARTMGDPGKPENIQAVDYGSDYITLIWKQPSKCVRGLGVFCQEWDSLPTTLTPSFSQSSTVENLVDVEGVKPEEYMEGVEAENTIQNLKECTMYTCWVQYPHTEQGYVESDRVTEKTWVTGISITAPTHIETLPGLEHVQVSWNAPEKGARCVDGYQLKWKETGESEWNTLPDMVKSYSTIIENVRPCTELLVRVYGVSWNWGQDKVGKGGEVTVNTSHRAPGPVTNLQVVSSFADSVIVSWEDPLDDPQCIHRYDTRLAGNIQDDCDSNVETDSQEYIGNTQYMLKCLICEELYNFTVWAVDAVGHMSPPAQLLSIQPNCTGE